MGSQLFSSICDGGRTPGTLSNKMRCIILVAVMITLMGLCVSGDESWCRILTAMSCVNRQPVVATTDNTWMMCLDEKLADTLCPEACNRLFNNLNYNGNGGCDFLDGLADILDFVNKK